jgi:hypothetical protein
MIATAGSPAVNIAPLTWPCSAEARPCGSPDGFPYRSISAVCLLDFDATLSSSSSQDLTVLEPLGGLGRDHGLKGSRKEDGEKGGDDVGNGGCSVDRGKGASFENIDLLDSRVGPLDVCGRRDDFFDDLGRRGLPGSSASGGAVPCRWERCNRIEVGDLDFERELATFRLSTLA